MAEIIERSDMTPGELLSYPVVSLDGTNFVKNPSRGWSVAGLGFVGGMLEPFKDSDLMEKAAKASNIAVVPDPNGNTIVIVKGCEHLRGGGR